TAGRLIGNASASAPTEVGPALSRSTMARRFGSPRASNGSPFGGVTLRSRPGTGRSPRAHAVVAGVVLDLGQAELLEHRRDVVGEATAEALLQAVPAADRVVVRAAPRLDGPLGCRLLLVGVAERHPVARRHQ